MKYITTQWLITHISGFRKTNVNKKEASNCSNIKYFISVPVTIYNVLGGSTHLDSVRGVRIPFGPW